MGKIEFHNIPDAEKATIFNEISAKTGMPPYAVEKDWWVVRTLEIIFEMEIGPHLVFKGGTSLSKAWGLIERFSEDIDLAVDRSFFGFDGELGKSKITRLRKTTSKYISEIFYPALEKKFKEKGLEGVELKLVEAKDSDQDPRIIEIYYPYVIEIGSPVYVEPRVQVEIGCRSLREPYTEKAFGSLVDEHYSGKDFALPAIKIPTVNPERTLLEKIFLLHEEFQRPKEKMRVERLSRHLYDIAQLSKTDFLHEALKHRELYETIVNHRYRFTRVGHINYTLHQPQTINPIPPEDVRPDWEGDYKTMQEQMIYGESPSFNDLIDGVGELKSIINVLDWEINGPFIKKS